ncbi:M16 family metallopeptidase [Occallatibacter riparius]|uniref:Insulinase family protein n=1 Tax=Occallatibacter riparius TaxID=1002689 RepID=A0A9J7BKP0_9BACT|nr:pitrilysin family protein [Occallatibacter riparius]UWZ83009.1 insulinase family protein [Occallatibacter riparius]
MTIERNLRRTVLPNGLIVLTERMEHLRSVAMGVWIKSGSRGEAAETNGISHFVEHMVFKGTRNRTAQHIAREMDSIGGNLDAFTGKETICFNVKSLADHVPIALDVLSDLVLNPVFASSDIERERGVILEEIKIDEDNPDVLVHELFTQSFWKDHPLGKPILGTTQTVNRLDQPKLLDYHSGRFHAGNMVFSAAGNLAHDEFVEAVAKQFAPLHSGQPLTELAAPVSSARILLKNKKALEQVQICLGVPSPAITDENRYATLILNTVLGGGMSSRLFQTIREERGMAYSVFSDLSPYRDTGTLCVYAGTSAAKALECIDLVMTEFRKLKEEPLSDEELTRAKDQLKGNILMGLESSNSRMANLARQEIYFGQFFSADEIIAKVEAVTPEQVQAMAQRLFDPEKIAVTLLGRLDGIKLNRQRLVC